MLKIRWAHRFFLLFFFFLLLAENILSERGFCRSSTPCSCAFLTCREEAKCLFVVKETQQMRLPSLLLIIVIHFYLRERKPERATKKNCDKTFTHPLLWFIEIPLFFSSLRDTSGLGVGSCGGGGGPSSSPLSKHQLMMNARLPFSLHISYKK